MSFTSPGLFDLLPFPLSFPSHSSALWVSHIQEKCWFWSERKYPRYLLRGLERCLVMEIDNLGFQTWLHQLPAIGHGENISFSMMLCFLVSRMGIYHWDILTGVRWDLSEVSFMTLLHKLQTSEYMFIWDYTLSYWRIQLERWLGWEWTELLY